LPKSLKTAQLSQVIILNQTSRTENPCVGCSILLETILVT